MIPNSVTALAEFVLQEEKAPEKEVSILLTDDAEISKLNARHLGRKGPTDVLAFPMDGGEQVNPRPEILGDVVVSAERAAAYAREHRLDIESELSLYLIHGLLHLLGYDDVSAGDAGKMRRREKELLHEAHERGLMIRTG